MKQKLSTTQNQGHSTNMLLAAGAPETALSTDGTALDVELALRGSGICATSKPIMFSTPMVTAILEGRKTQTRRIIKEQPDQDGLWNHTKLPMSIDPRYDMEGWWGTVDETGESKQYKCPYGWETDLLWVRERWMYYKDCTQGSFGYTKGEQIFWPPYKLEGVIRRCVEFYQQYPKFKTKWKPSIHMPKTAARIFLLNEGVKVERLHDITEEDALREGVLFYDDEILKSRRFKDYFSDASGYGHPDFDYPTLPTAKDSFASLWKSINGEDSWNENPWVWVVDFKLIALKASSMKFFNK